MTILLLAALLAAFVSTSPTPRTHEEAPVLQLMSFNIRYGTARDGDDAWLHRKELVFDVLREQPPDVAGLQEALHFQLEEILEAVPGYASVGIGRDDGRASGEYAAILFRPERFDVAESGTFWLSDTPETPGSRHWGNTVVRICTWARFIERSSGRGFYVYNTHLDHHSQEARERGADLLMRRIGARAFQTEPVYITGDLNAGETNAAVVRIKGPADGPTFIDTFRAAHPDEKNAGTFHGFGRAPGPDKIDYIFVQPGTPVLDAQILRTNRDGRYPSDHFPVTARVKLTSSGK